MINFKNNNISPPYKEFRRRYELALNAGQPYIEAISISSYCLLSKQVNSRYVNLKIINDQDFIFFTNYNSPKSKQLMEHPQASINIFWHTINTQIRIKGTIKKAPSNFNQDYFKSRNKEKNALAICSNQSEKIDSFKKIQIKFDDALKNQDLNNCPEYWGGFLLTPFEFEFWEGGKHRLNKRDLYVLINGSWTNSILEP